jgi:hypothetical protein
MSRDLITLQFKNSRIRGKVEHLSKGASESVNAKLIELRASKHRQRMAIPKSGFKTYMKTCGDAHWFS